MQHFLSILIITLAHSIWQSGLLYAFYRLLFSSPKIHPESHKQAIYLLLSIQLLLSIISFLFLWNENGLIELQFLNQNIYEPIISTLGFAYISYFIFRIFIQIKNGWQFNQYILKNAEKPNVDLRIFVNQISELIGIKRKVNLKMIDLKISPLTFGFLKPFILLPFNAISGLNEQQIKSVILHELYHIKQKDYLWNYLIVMVEQIYFFNPCIYLLTKKLRHERELACDCFVIDMGIPKILYAESLVTIAKLNRKANNLSLGIHFSDRKNQLIDRIKFFTAENLLFSDSKMRIWLLPFALLLGIISFVSPEKSNEKFANIKLDFGKYINGNKKQITVTNTENTTTTTSTETRYQSSDNNNFIVLQPEIPQSLPQENIAPIAEVEQPIIEPIPHVSYASTIETDKQDSVNYIVVSELHSGKKETMVYQVIYINGQIIRVPLLNVLEKIAQDSLTNIEDSVKEIKF